MQPFIITLHTFVTLTCEFLSLIHGISLPIDKHRIHMLNHYFSDRQMTPFIY